MLSAFTWNRHLSWSCDVDWRLRVHAGVRNCVSQIGPYPNGPMHVPLHMHTCRCGNLPI